MRVVQSSQSGLGQGAARSTAAVRPQEQHRAERRWQAGHHGRPVIRDVPQGFSSPQIEQVAIGKGGQVRQIGPSGVRRLTGRRRPQLRQTSRLSGSVIKQFGHNGRPCSSRVAGSRRAPQREHSSMREWAMQVRQTRCPSSGLSIRTTRWQRGQAGRTIPATPAACRASISGMIARTGCEMPSAGEQLGMSFHRPGEFLR